MLVRWPWGSRDGTTGPFARWRSESTVVRLAARGQAYARIAPFFTRLLSRGWLGCDESWSRVTHTTTVAGGKSLILISLLRRLQRALQFRTRENCVFQPCWIDATKERCETFLWLPKRIRTKTATQLILIFVWKVVVVVYVTALFSSVCSAFAFLYFEIGPLTAEPLLRLSLLTRNFPQIYLFLLYLVALFRPSATEWVYVLECLRKTH